MHPHWYVSSMPVCRSAELPVRSIVVGPDVRQPGTVTSDFDSMRPASAPTAWSTGKADSVTPEFLVSDYRSGAATEMQVSLQ